MAAPPPGGPQGPGGPPQPPPQEQKFDHFDRVKKLMWSVKDSLANLMRIAAQNLNRNVCIDLGMKAPEKVPRFDKQLEDFVTLCNQIELHLKTIQECTVQLKESHQYLNVQINPNKPDNQPAIPFQSPEPMPVSYGEYMALVKNQAAYAKDLQQLIFNELTGASVPPSQAESQPPQE